MSLLRCANCDANKFPTLNPTTLSNTLRKDTIEPLTICFEIIALRATQSSRQQRQIAAGSMVSSSSTSMLGARTTRCLKRLCQSIDELRGSFSSLKGRRGRDAMRIRIYGRCPASSAQRSQTADSDREWSNIINKNASIMRCHRSSNAFVK